MRESAAEGGGDMSAWRARVEADDIGAPGRLAVDAEVTGRDDPFAAAAADEDEDDWISPAAAESLLVKEEMAQPAHDAACSLGWGVLMRVTASPVFCGGRALSVMSVAALRILCMYMSMLLFACSRTSFSLSMSSGEMEGTIRHAQSSSLKYSTVTANAMSAALRAWTKGSRIEREKAAINTFALDEDPRCLAILPRHIVVFVRIPGCSSFAVLARYRSSSPFIVRSESLVTRVRTDFSVCSRTTGAKSVKPLT